MRPAADERDVAGVDTRLVEAADGREWLEVVLVVRGSVRRTADRKRWRMRVTGGSMVTFCADWVVAVTRKTRRP